MNTASITEARTNCWRWGSEVELHEVVAQIGQFSRWNHTERIKFFAWHLHTHKGKDHFQAVEVTKCFRELHLDPPPSIHPLLNALVNRSPKILLRGARGYSLERATRDVFTKKYGDRAATVHVDKLLSELPSKVPNLAERTYLDEALQCFRIKAYRASIVMAWNLAYDHLCQCVLTNHLADFNTQLPKTYPKADVQSITKREDFTELKESQVIQVCKSAGIISHNVNKVMKEKLDRRNIAAHPSTVSTSQLTAEEFIKDLVENVVLVLA